MMQFEELVQIGINNLIIARANGRELGIHELRLIDQFAKTTQVSLRLQEVTLQRELDYYEKTGQFTNEDAHNDPESPGDGNNNPRPKI